MGLRDSFNRFRAALTTPLTAPQLNAEVPTAVQPPTTGAPPSERVQDIEAHLLHGGGTSTFYGGFRQSASALINMFTGQGTSKDPSSFNAWGVPRCLSEPERFGMGRNALIQQALGKLPNTATRAGWRTEITDPNVEDKPAVSDKISAYEERLGLGQKINRALFRGRQHSQAMVILGIDDGRDFDQPVDVENIKTIRWAVTIDSRDFYTDKLAPQTSELYGGPELFQITDINGILEDGQRLGNGTTSYTAADWENIFGEQRERQGGQLKVHADRVLYFPTADYFSLLDSLQDSLGAYFESVNGVRTAARESSLVKYKIDQLKQQMWSANGDLAREHMSLLDRGKSVLNAFVVGDGEDVEVINRPLAGVADLPNPIMAWVAAALGIPNTIFWQITPGGFGKGEGERATFHEDVNAFQDQVLTPPLTKVHGYILAAEDGAQLPATTQRAIKYNDLTPPDEIKRSQLRSEAIDDTLKLFGAGAVNRAEVRDSLEGLADEYFRLQIGEELVEKPQPAQVGIFTGTVAALQAVYPGGIPPQAVRAMLVALDPVHFTPENISGIVPITEPAESLDPTDPAGEPGSSPLGRPSLLPADEEDGEAEPSEIELKWAEVDPPAGAKTAKELASEPPLSDDNVTSRQIKQLANPNSPGKLNAYKPRGFSTEPLFVLEEVQRALLERQGHMAAVEPAADVGPRSLFVSFKLPPALARWVPYKEKDNSAPHITLSYVKSVAPEQLPAILAELRETFASFDPIDIHVVGTPVQYFDNPKDRERVAFSRAEFNESQSLFDDLKDAFDSFGLNASTHGDFKPHVTLAYLDEGVHYNGPSPDGDWKAESAEVHYGGELLETMPLEGRAPVEEAQPTADKGPRIQEGYIWRTQKDERVRPTHRKLEGRRFHPGTGHPTEGAPGEAPNCRCAKQIIVPPKGTKRARAASERTTRRALRRNFKRVSGAANKHKL